MIGFNMAALRYVQRDMELNSSAVFFDVREKMIAKTERKTKKRRKQHKGDSNDGKTGE